ncbi:MAG: hypothetical protein N2490_06085 [Ignavibacteria bacterium]|nr:hypothetical protein [Ignavibacteria bacterium]
MKTFTNKVIQKIKKESISKTIVLSSLAMCTNNSCLTLYTKKSPDIVYEPTIKIANKKDGLLHLSVVYPNNRVLGFGPQAGYQDPYEKNMPKVNWEGAHPKILERCKSLGYNSYKRFDDYSSKNCIEMDMVGCKKMEMIWECQCTDKVENK